ncbi:MAG: FYVE zinc finger domain-containing protein [Syntrophobacteraceae bacterium]|nr:FYVE zinc finger domain-containing protein [Desulfobacteraceae bacterium]
MATKEQKAMAAKRLGEIGPLGAKLMSRARDLINNPALVDQDAFGICGMAASTHILLHYDPLRFVDLLRAIFNGEPFEGIDVGRKYYAPSPGNLLEHRLEQYERKRKTITGTDEIAKFQKTELDFLVCRSIGKLLKATDLPLYTASKDFSKKFAPGMGIQPDDILKAGDLALTGEAVHHILKEIVQVPSVTTVDQPRLNNERAVIDSINNWFRTERGREPLIAAAVNKGCYSNGQKNLAAWLTGQACPDVPCPPRLPTEPGFDHWILITGPVTAKGSTYEIPLWTWGEPYTGKLKQGLVSGYIRSLVCAAQAPAKTAMPLIIPKSSPDWLADSTASKCSRPGCGKELKAGHRHHCRLCGKLFCDDCCPELEMVPARVVANPKIAQKYSAIPGPVRVCSDCFREHAGFSWMRDSEAVRCTICGKEFGTFRRRHHCRFCGNLVCSDCSGQKRKSSQMGYIQPVRICRNCARRIV